MRLFIAIEIPDEIKRKMAEIQRILQDTGVDAGWTRPEGIHLTLTFLGEVPESRVPDIYRGMEQAAQGTGPLHLEVKGIGAFPNPKNARVVWVGIAGDIERLSRLQTAVEEAMADCGFEREKRNFTPHLTLGRIKYIRSRDQWLKALGGIKDIQLTGFDVGSISLMKSELRPSGAVYTEVGRVEVRGMGPVARGQ